MSGTDDGAGDQSDRAPRTRVLADVPERVLDVLRARRPLVVLRGPRGYGKTTAIRRWLEELDGSVKTVFVTLTEESNLLADFWVELRTLIEQNGVQIETRGDDRWSVLTALAEYPEPLLLVIDDFHEAGLDDDDGGAGAIDDDLVDVVRQNDRIDLVIGTRTYRTLETTGMLSVDGVVLGPDDLKMTGRTVYELAQQLGIPMTLDQGEEIAVDTGGWPSVVRAGLVRSTTGSAGTFDAGLVEDYVVNLISDLRFPSVRAFVLRTAVPEQFTAEMARLLSTAGTLKGSEAPSGAVEPLRILRNMRSAGLLSERWTAEGKMYAYAPAVRAAIQRLGRELEPEMIREVHRTLMTHSAGLHDPIGVLVHAVEAAEFETALEIIEREWSRLLATAPSLLQETALRFPPQLVAAHPRLRIAGSDLGAARLSPDSPWSVEVASSFAAEVDEHLADPAGGSVEEASALMHWAITGLLIGNLDAASYAFNRARTLGLVGRAPEETVQLAAIGLALTHAFEGEPDLALRWLDDLAVRDRLAAVHEVDGRDIAVVAGLLARAIAQTHAADPEAAATLAAMSEPGHRDDLWAATVFVRGFHAAHAGDRAALAPMANEVRAAMRHVARGSLIEVVLASALVELLIADDAVDVAEQVADRFETGAIAFGARARCALADGRHEQAIQLAERALEFSERSWTTAIDCHVVLATAHHALGDEAKAREWFRHAARMAQGTGQRRPFLIMPRYVFESVVGDDARLLALWPAVATPAPERRTVTRAPADLPALTTREVQILRALEAHPGPVGIGKELGLSANTVKTHLRAVYRKLGVTNRSEAMDAIETMRGAS